MVKLKHFFSVHAVTVFTRNVPACGKLKIPVSSSARPLQTTKQDVAKIRQSILPLAWKFNSFLFLDDKFTNVQSFQKQIG